MIDDFESQEARPGGELWSQICSSLPDVQEEADQGHHAQFTDSFQPSSLTGVQPTAQSIDHSNGIAATSSHNKWEPMEDTDIYIASLENRLRRLKGQSSEVTSRDMLRSLSQAKKECWDRFLHDAQTSELFQTDDMDDSALEQLKRWLIPEKVAISAEELEFLLLPSQGREGATSEPDMNSQPGPAPEEQGPAGETLPPEGHDSPTPEK